MIETYLYDLCKKGDLRHHFLLQVGSHYPGNNENYPVRAMFCSEKIIAQSTSLIIDTNLTCMKAAQFLYLDSPS